MLIKLFLLRLITSIIAIQFINLLENFLKRQININIMWDLLDKIPAIQEKVPSVLLNLTVIIIILLIGFIFAKLIGKLVHKALHEAEIDNILKKIGIKFSLENVLSIITTYIIYIITIIMALNQLGVTTTILQIILIGIIILAILFAFISLKDFVPNTLSSFFIYKKDIFKKGDRIRVHNIEGKVENIGFVETEIITKKGDKIYIPNSTLIKSELTVRKRKK